MIMSKLFQIRHNINVYDRIHDKYEEKHRDIFNPVEQDRLRKKLEQGVRSIKTSSSNKTALDYGCGSGNLTKHLIDLGMHTVAADLSKNFLALVARQYSHTGKLDVLEIDGQSLSNVEDNCFDLVAAYAVLHHVPDFLGIIKEMVRVLKRGGIIYLDHERSNSYWNKEKRYLDFMRLSSPKRKKKWGKYLKLSNYLLKLRRIIYPRYTSEGDIHVFPDDHIECEKIENLLTTQGCEIVLKENYLLYMTGYSIDVYQEYRNNCNDMYLLIARKK